MSVPLVSLKFMTEYACRRLGRTCLGQGFDSPRLHHFDLTARLQKGENAKNANLDDNEGRSDG